MLANADFVIARDTGSKPRKEQFPDHALVALIERRDGFIRLLRSRRPATIPYRTLYAREFLTRNPGLPEDEARLVAKELLMAAVLAGDEAEVSALLRAFPSLQRDAPATRNIYWIGGYDRLVELSEQRMRSGSPVRP